MDETSDRWRNTRRTAPCPLRKRMVGSRKLICSRRWHAYATIHRRRERINRKINGLLPASKAIPAPGLQIYHLSHPTCTRTAYRTPSITVALPMKPWRVVMALPDCLNFDGDRDELVPHLPNSHDLLLNLLPSTVCAVLLSLTRSASVRVGAKKDWIADVTGETRCRCCLVHRLYAFDRWAVASHPAICSLFVSLTFKFANWAFIR